jgi:hypothetical protein
VRNRTRPRSLHDVLEARARHRDDRHTPVDPFAWRFERTMARVGPTVEAILAEHATSYWRLPVRRRVLDGRVAWSIDREIVLELRVGVRRPATLVVHDFGMFDQLHKALRTRHVSVRHATVGDRSQVSGWPASDP